MLYTMLKSKKLAIAEKQFEIAKLNIEIEDLEATHYANEMMNKITQLLIQKKKLDIQIEEMYIQWYSKMENIPAEVQE
jgi:hypothetical protein